MGKLKLAVCGATGRMGTRILALAAAEPDRFAPLYGITSKGKGTMNDGQTELVSDLAAVLPKVDAVIDFSTHKATLGFAKACAAAKKPIVIGTTGLDADAIAALKLTGKTIPIVFSPNMSVGMNVLFKILSDAASALKHYDIEIVEFHHNQKKDAPSGSAMRLAQVAALASDRSEKDFMYGRQGLVGARKNKEIGVLAGRAGDIVGDHTVYIAGPGERLELTHRAHSRDAFAAGSLTAAAWLVKQKPGFYSMRDVLGF